MSPNASRQSTGKMTNRPHFANIHVQPPPPPRRNHCMNHSLNISFCNGRDLMAWISCSDTENYFPQNFSMLFMANPSNYTPNSGFPSVIFEASPQYCRKAYWTKMVQNGQNDHFGQNDLIPNRFLVFARPKWTILVHFGPLWPKEVYFGPFRSANRTLATPEIS